MRLRFLLVPLLALLPVLTFSGPASAQSVGVVCTTPSVLPQYPPSAGVLVLSKIIVRQGESLVATATGFGFNCTVTLEFRSAPVSLGSVQSNATGGFSTTVTVPVDATLGLHTIAAIAVDQAGRRQELLATLTVVDENGGVGAGQLDRDGSALPRTGAATVLPTGLAGAALIGVGTLVVLATRRKRAAH